jgi:hypothetical protein
MTMRSTFPTLKLPLDMGARATGRNERRQVMRQEALSWTKGTDPYHPAFTPVYVVGAHEVRAGRPGKEAARVKNPNHDDTFPAVFEGRNDIGFVPTLETYFDDVFELATSDHRSGELVGALLYRSIHLLDHHANALGQIRWEPDSTVIDEIRRRTPTIEVGTFRGARSIDIEVYLKSLEVLLINEDIKYGRGRIGDSGRPNTLSTVLAVVAVGAGHLTAAKLAYSMAIGRGVVGRRVMDRGLAVRLFPDLG